MSKLNRSALVALLSAYSDPSDQETRIGAITDHRGLTGYAGARMNQGALQRAFGGVARPPQFMTAQRGGQAPAPFYNPPPQAYVADPYGSQPDNGLRNRYHYMAVNSVGTVAANASQVCSTQPQAVAFRPARILVPASIAPDFTIDSIFCGIKPQFVATGSISAETFTQDSRGCDMLMDEVGTSQNFTLNVTNQSGAARQFRATVFGDSADT